MGIPIDDFCLFTLSFADDQVVFAQDSYDMEFMLQRLYRQYNEWGLRINTCKTEYMVVNSSAQFPIFISDNETVKQVDQFKYLGVLINKDEGIGRTEIKNRIEQSRKVIGCLNSVWWDRNISRDVKKHIGRTMVESVLSYGSEVWTLSAEMKRKINTVEMDYLRRSEGISRLQRINNEDIRQRANAHETILERIERRGLKWFGHMMRMDEQRLPLKLFKWNPPGRRKVSNVSSIYVRKSVKSDQKL